MEGYTLKRLKGFKFEVIKDMFDKAFKRVNTFVDYKIELVEDDAKVDDDQEEARMKELINIVPDEEEVAIDDIPLATKPPCIVDWKIIKEGKISQFQIIRADGSSKRYSAFIHMLRNFDREDLETLWKLVKAKHSTLSEVAIYAYLYAGREKLQGFVNPNTIKSVRIILRLKAWGKNVNTARLKAIVNAVKGKKINAVKASACWILKPKNKVLDHVSKHNSASITIKKFDYVDTQGRSKHMTGNMSYLTNYEDIDGGYVSFEGNPKGGKITRKVVKRRNRKLIEAARTMLADSKFSTTFWTETVNTACYVQNRVLVVKPHNKTPYELFHGRTPTLSFMRPFGCFVTILNTIDHLGKFNGKADKGFFVGYSLNSKAFRVFNSKTMIVEENLHIRFSESTPNVVGSGPNWLFNIDALTRTMNYEPIIAGTQSNDFVGTKASDNVGQARKETELVKDYILLPLWTADPPFSQDPKSSQDDESKPSSDDRKKVDEDPRKESECNDQEKEDNVNITNNVNAAGINKVNVDRRKTSIKLPVDPNMPTLEDDNIFDYSSDDEDVGAEADMNNLDTTIQVSPILTTRIHKDHLLDQEEPKKVNHALKDPSWIEAMQEELLQFKLQEKELCNSFEKLMHKKFQMSSMGELTFFLGLQVKEKEHGIFISQDKYDEDGEEVDVHMYRSMIGSLMYLTSSRPDIMFALCACSRYQVNPKVSHLHAMKRIFRYLKDSIDLNGATRNTTRLRQFCFTLRDRAINWLDHLPAGSISTWDDLTTLLHHGLDLWLQVQIFYDHINYTTQMAIDDAAGERLRRLRPEEAWKTIKDLAQYE
ncbi:ribonuclease H-like domain-containing protein [Tanacetum coccineum]|uniref:Ribonuclease H-like domain-containing protein n=1 Tax=Tanacetum coccineum TaxID=301880 RepID=A0ABQ4WZT9_9ASTR